MQDIIRLLPDNVANQIAAGEVVQRPASVVKELLENAIDARATHIQLIIKDAGRNLIQVIDDGIGMSETDARMAFERHSTSKIFNSDDIYRIKTKGFRGEALASISAVSQVELKSKTDFNEMGTRILIDANEVILQEPTIQVKGSSFSIKNLFYNVPARRKFLKSNHVEFRHIVDEFLRVSLTHPEIGFQLTHQDKEVFHFRKTNLVQRIVDAFGKKIKTNLVPIEVDLDWIQIKGYIGKPESAKKTRGEQYMFANQRYFRSPYFHKAILDAYDGLLPNAYHPSYFIYFTIDPEKIDVNIHPSKTEIKFENESDLYALLRSTLKQSIGVYNVAPSLDFDQDDAWHGDILTPSIQKNVQAPKIKIDPHYNPFTSQPAQRPSSQEKVEIASLYQSTTIPEIEEKSETLDFFKNGWSPLGNGLWILAENNEVKIINPYRVHQSVLYAQLKEISQDKKISQQLLFPIEFPIEERRKVQLSAVSESLFQLGFEFDDSTEFLSISAIPEHLLSENIIRLFEELFEELESHSDEKFLEYFYQKAASVNAKPKTNWINPQDIKDLWLSFQEIGSPQYSPHQKTNYTLMDISKNIKNLL